MSLVINYFFNVFRMKAHLCRQWVCAMDTDSKTLSDPLTERVQPIYGTVVIINDALYPLL